jgi:hypothetical protein
VPIKVCCPKCKKVTTAPDEYAGKKVKCRCGAVFVLPKPAVENSPSASLWNLSDEQAVAGSPVTTAPRGARNAPFSSTNQAPVSAVCVGGPASRSGWLAGFQQRKLAIAVSVVTLIWLVCLASIMMFGVRYFFWLLPLAGVAIAFFGFWLPVVKRSGPHGPWLRRRFVQVAVISGLIGVAIVAFPFVLLLAASCGIHLPEGTFSRESYNEVHATSYMIATILMKIMSLSFATCFVSLTASITWRLGHQYGPSGAASILYLVFSTPLLVVLAPLCFFSPPGATHSPPTFPAPGTGMPQAQHVPGPQPVQPPEMKAPPAPAAASAPMLARDQRAGGGGISRRGRSGMRPPDIRMELLGAEAVQKELKLTTEQQATLRAFLSESNRKQEAEAERLERLLHTNPREYHQEMMKNLKGKAQETAAIEQKIREILQPPQLERLNQIRLQIAGPSALTEPDVQTALELTPSQTSQIRSISQTSSSQIQAALSSINPSDPSASHKRAHEIRKAAAEQLMNVLTADQKLKLEKIKGDKVDVRLP